MRSSCNFLNANVISRIALNVYRNMAASKKTKMVFSYDNSVIVSNSDFWPAATRDVSLV